jgi:4-amino-4-deoxy-L-arabinose transferase-like glycosyltransferase
MTQRNPPDSLPLSNVRWLTATMGVILLVLGQLQIAGAAIQVTSSMALGDWLTNTLHLGVPDINNVLLGIPILILGVILLAISLQGFSLLPFQSEEYAKTEPVALRLVKSLWPWLLAGLASFVILLIQLSGLKYGFYSPIIWIAVLLVFAAVLAVWDHRRKIDLSPHLSRNDLIWLVGLLLAGFLIGTYRLQGWPDQLIGDEGNFWTTARDIALGKFEPAIFASGVYSFPILGSFLQGWIIKLFGVTLWGLRMASVLPGVITVVPLYLLVRDLFNKKIAIASSIVLITNPYFLAFARLGYNNIQAIFIPCLTFYWLYNGLRRNSHFLLFLAGCAAGLGFYTYFGARGTVFTAILFILLTWLTKKIKFRQAAFSLVIMGIAFLLVTLPYIIYGLNQDAQSMGFKMFESVFINVFNGSQFYSNSELFKYAPVIHFEGNDLFFNPPIYAVLFSQGLIRTLLAFQNSGLISEHYIAFPLTGTIGVFFYLLGLGFIIKHCKESRNQLLILWFMTIVVGFSALNTVPPRHTHMVAVIPALAILIGLGVDAIAESLATLIGRMKKVGFPILATLLAVVAIGGLYDYFVRAPEKYRPQPDQIMSWAGLDSHGESFIYVNPDASQMDFKPYIMDEFDTSISIRTVAWDDVVSGTQGFQSSLKTILFYPPEIASKMNSILAHQWGETFIQRTFYNSDGNPVLAAGMNTLFTFEQDRPILSTFLDAFRHLPFIILILVLLVSLGLVAFLPGSFVASLPGKVKPFFEWLNRPPPPEVLDEASSEDPFLPEILASIPLQSVPDEAPAWADKFITSNEPSKADRLNGEIKSVKSPEGKDVFIHIHFPSIRLGIPPLSQGWNISIPPIHFPNSTLLISSIFVAIAGQFAITHQWYVFGALLYLACATGLFFWSRRNPKWIGIFTNQVRIFPRMEVIFAIILLAAIAFTRFYDLGYRVYGLEADETKWTAQSWYSTILRVDKGEFAEAHYQYLPVGFWVRSVFLRLFGVNFISARIESAFLSLLSAVFLYYLVRRLTTSPPMAWLSTALYSFSFVELNESHQALHNTTVEIWIMSGLFFLILALQKRKYWQFQLAGIVLALGMLTYETYFATPLIATLFLVGVAIVWIVKKKDPPITWLKRVLVFLWPIALFYILFIQGYLASQNYQFGNLAVSSANGSNILGLVQFMLKNGVDYLKTMFVQVVWTDSLIRWDGPFLNPWLIVFVVIGLIYNLLNLRRPYFLFIPLWFLANVIYAPILVGSVWPRVLYTTLGPLAIWGAMGLWTFLAGLRTWFDGLKLKFALPIFAILLVAILFNDYHIFTSSLSDPSDRQKRRELADLTAQSAASVPMILYPYEANQDDSVVLESHVLLFSVAGAHKIGLDAAKYYQPVEFDQTLLTLYQDRRLDSVDLIFDKTATNRVDERFASMQVILHCYPAATMTTYGQFFNVYHFDGKTLAQPECYQGPPPVAISPQNGAVLSASEPTTLKWNADGLAITGHSITVERKVPNNYWVEVEEAFQGPGWSPSSEYVNDFTGSGFLYDNWDAGAAEYSLPIDQTGRYHIWVRSYKREKNDQVNFITVNGIKTEFASNSTTLNAWVWDDIGTYTLSKGSLPIQLTRTYGNDDEYSVFIDSILVTSDLLDPPDHISIWQNVLDSGMIPSASSEYSLPQALSPGEYRWKVRLFNGDRLIDSTGTQGVASQLASFIISSR